MNVIGGPAWVKGALVERKDTGQRGTLCGDEFGDYSAVWWEDDTTTWIRSALLRLVQVPVT